MTSRPALAALASSAIALAAPIVLVAHDARAAKPSLTLTAQPMFGQEGSSATGWTGVVARLESGGAAQKGVLELRVKAASWRGEEQSATLRAPFHAPPGNAVLVHLPIMLSSHAMPTVHLRAAGDGDATLAEATLSVPAVVQPVLVDVSNPSRLLAAMRGAKIATEWAPSDAGGRSPTTFAVGVPTFDSASGDPVLPRRAAEWASATVVLLRSDAYARLAPGAREALDRWVVAGGTVAVVPVRPEDLRAGPLVALMGGEARPVPPSPALLAGQRPPPRDEAEEKQEDDEDPKPSPAVPMRWVPTSTSSAQAALTPAPAVLARLTGYAGNTLTPSAYGATARVGLGEIHLLAFDPTVRPMVDDRWVQGRLGAMVERAWDRRAASAFPLGFRSSHPGEDTEVRRALDPNENFRPALAVASLLLLLYAVLVGPVLFLVSARRGRPLAPLKWAPIMSAATFGLIVLIGFAGRGFRGRARHLALVEAPAGDGRATVRRFRGFFASGTESLVIPATDASGMLDVMTSEAQKTGKSVLRLERDGMTLEGLTSLPWQTLVVREDALATLGRGVSISATPSGDASVTNRTGHRLRDLVVWVPRSGLYYAPELADGAALTAKASRFLRAPRLLGTTTAGTLRVHRLSTAYLSADIGGKEGPRVADAWRALESAAGDGVDWFPDDAPVVLGVIDGLPDGARDAGLPVESSRSLLRVLGEGGS